MKKIQALIDRIDEFPTLPSIYTSLLEVISNPNSTVQDVANIIQKDQSSTVKILKSVNSSLYGIQGKISNLNQAIFYLGFNEVKNLLISISVIDIFSNIKSSSNFNIADFWKHSIAVGVITRSIGKLLSIKDLDNFFLSGIIHDIGKLFFLKFFKDEYLDLINSTGKNNRLIIEEELDAFGVSHCVVGSLIAMKWKLPVPITNVINNHITGLISGKPDLLCMSVHLADIIARTLELGNPGDNFVPEPNFDIWKEMMLPQGAIMNIYPEIINNYNQSINVLLINK